MFKQLFTEKRDILSMDYELKDGKTLKVFYELLGTKAQFKVPQRKHVGEINPPMSDVITVSDKRIKNDPELLIKNYLRKMDY